MYWSPLARVTQSNLGRGPGGGLRLGDLANFEAGWSKKSKKSEKVDQKRKFFDFLKVVKMSKFECLGYSFDRKSGFFFAKKIKIFPTGLKGAWPSTRERDLAIFEARGVQKVEKT